MPRLYLTPAQLNLYPVALTFAFQIQQLSALSGAMDQLLARASRRVDGYAKKRIASPPATTIATGGIVAGQTSLPVTSTLGLDNGQEEAVIIGSGGTQEIIAVAPGGVNVSSWSTPYPGSLQLASPVAYNHSAGETVQGCYQEISTVGSSGNNDILGRSMVQFDQGAQVAMAHAPYAGTQELTRVIFLKCYPIRSVLKLEHMLPFASEYGPIEASRLGIASAAGYIRLTLGSFVLIEGLMRITYQAGFSNVPDDIALATSYYVADELQTMESRGAYDVHSDRRRTRYRDTQSQKSNYVLEAERLIDDGNYRKRSV